MGFSSWFVIAGAIMLVRNRMKKKKTDLDDFSIEPNDFLDDDDDIFDDFKTWESEFDRTNSVSNQRRSTPCNFIDGLSEDDFEAIAEYAGRKIKRINSVTVLGAVIYCNVDSQTGYSDWDFSVDFNNWGHVTGVFWPRTDNDDSNIPNHYGRIVSGLIHEYYQEKGISLKDFSDYVDDNKDLGTPAGFSYCYKDNLLGRLFRNKENGIIISCGSTELVGEHLYPVISMLRAEGFKNIKTVPVYDINDNSVWYYYQVARVSIDDKKIFESGSRFREKAEIIITYHEKQRITMPYSESNLKNDNYFRVAEKLQNLGFTKIYVRKIEDLITGWIVKDGSVESVLLDDDDNKHIEKNELYDYDRKIVICYHTKKC